MMVIKFLFKHIILRDILFQKEFIYAMIISLFLYQIYLR